jgi:4-amino-4-deoxy-L-arabinose transferase-like glycosyltransferase
MTFAWLRWRRTHHIGWAAAVGFFAGWAAITRPLDAITYAIPIGVAMLWMLRRTTVREWLTTIASLIIPALPFLALQAVQNVALTGEVLKTPYQLSAERYTPGVGLGFGTYDHTRRPRTELAQWHAYHDRFTTKYLKAHRADLIHHTWLRDRVPRLMSFTAPSPLLFTLLALGLTSLRGPRLAFFAALPLYLFVYALFPYFLPHYLMVIAPAIALGIVLGIETLRRTFPARASRLNAFLALAIVLLSAASLPGIDRMLRDDNWLAPTLALNARLPELVEQPAVVLFRYHPESSPHEEPVYNVDVASPDDAPIIRAHDFGPARNRALVRYYAERQPERRFYLVDRRTNSIGYLGVARDLADAPDAHLATTRPLPPRDGL